MKVLYHQVARTEQESFRVLEVRGTDHPCSWHFHPEYQLGLLLQGAGHRIIGDSIAPLVDGDLSLLGPNLPHVWQFENPGRAGAPDVHAIIVYFREDSFGEGFFDRPEAAGIHALLRRSTSGLAIHGRVRDEVADLMRAMVTHDGFQRVLDLLHILHRLAAATELTPLCSPGFTHELPDTDGERFRRVCGLIQEKIAGPLNRDEIAAAAHFSPGAFSRYFKARAGRTFQEFVTELRIGRACRLLGEIDLTVTEIALECGFESPASFNRSFRRVKRTNPTQYRRQLREIQGTRHQHSSNGRGPVHPAGSGWNRS